MQQSAGQSKVFEMTRTVGTRVAPLLGSFVTLVRQRAPFVARGAAVGLYGMLSTFRNPRIRDNYYGFIRTYLVLTAALYAVFFGLGLTVLSPVTLALVFIAPGFLIQLALAMPHHAFQLAREKNPHAFDNMFLQELEHIDTQYASRIQGGLANIQYRPSLVERVRQRIRARYWTYLRHTAVLTVIGLVPVLGALVAAVGQWLLVSEQMGQDLLRSWFEAERIPKSRRAELSQRYRWEIVGFCMPFTLMNAIPIIGVFGSALAQGATAHLVYRILSPPTGTAPESLLVPVQQAASDISSQVLHHPMAQRAMTGAVAMKDRALGMLYKKNEPATGSVGQQGGGQGGNGRLDTGGSGSVAETWRFGEGGDAGMQRQGMMGPTKMEADISSPLAKAAGIVRGGADSHVVPPSAPAYNE